LGGRTAEILAFGFVVDTYGLRLDARRIRHGRAAARNPDSYYFMT
jgi:hypothetical protein